MSHTPPPTAEALIRAAGVKVTRGRVRVLTMLISAPLPLSHTDIDAQFGEQGEEVMDRVTLYRVLDSLVACGLVLKATDTRGVFRFSAAPSQHQHEPHLHFRCTDCGGVFCLRTAPPAPPELPSGFRFGAMTCDVSGTCPACEPKPRNTNLPAE